MEKTIQIKVKGSELRNINELEDFQGDLKTLTEENYIKLRKEILDLGFCEPLVVWGKNILNGHQRIKTLKRMRDEEGFEIPAIPVNVVQADSFKEAKKMVLSLTSQFGKMSEESLMNFMKESDLEMDEVMNSFEFAGLDMESLEGLFSDDTGDIEFIEPLEDEELDDMVRNSDVEFFDEIRREVRRLCKVVDEDLCIEHEITLVHGIILDQIKRLPNDVFINEYREYNNR